MARGFSKGRGAQKGRVLGSFDADEAAILRILLTGQLELLDVDDPLGDDPDPLAKALGIGSLWADEPLHVPEDPALARLFPDAYRESEGEASEFRRLTEPDLREGKRLNARTALATLEAEQDDDVAIGAAKVSLDADEARAWLGAVNDLRLVLGTRLEITDDEDDPLQRISPDDQRFGAVHLYHWLGYVQETLIDALPHG
jgi:hypothetical protein